jgi:ELWxxDGT repeat protein
MIAVGNTLFFVASTTDEGVELWKTDGTATGTVLAKLPAPGSISSNASNLIQVGSKLYFVSYDLEGGSELWSL